MQIKRKDHFSRLIGIFLSFLLFAILSPKEVQARQSELSTSGCVTILHNLLYNAKQGNNWKRDNDKFIKRECRQFSGLILSANSLFNDIENPRSLKRAYEFRLQDTHRYKHSDHYPFWILVGAFLYAAPNGPDFNLEKSREYLLKLLIPYSPYRKAYPPVWRLAKIALQDLDRRGSLSPATISSSADVFKELETGWMIQFVRNAQTISNRSLSRNCSWWFLGSKLLRESSGFLIMITLAILCFALLEDHIRSKFTSKMFGWLIAKIDQKFSKRGTNNRFLLKECFYVGNILLISSANYLLSFHVLNDIFSLIGPSKNGNCQITWIGLWFFIVMVMILFPWIYIGMEWLKARENGQDRKMYAILVAMILSMPPWSILLPVAVIANAKGVGIADAISFGSLLRDSFVTFVSIIWATFVGKAIFQ